MLQLKRGALEIRGSGAVLNATTQPVLGMVKDFTQAAA